MLQSAHTQQERLYKIVASNKKCPRVQSSTYTVQQSTKFSPSLMLSHLKWPLAHFKNKRSKPLIYQLQCTQSDAVVIYCQPCAICISSNTGPTTFTGHYAQFRCARAWCSNSALQCSSHVSVQGFATRSKVPEEFRCPPLGRLPCTWKLIRLFNVLQALHRCMSLSV